MDSPATNWIVTKADGLAYSASKKWRCRKRPSIFAEKMAAKMDVLPSAKKNGRIIGGNANQSRFNLDEKNDTKKWISPRWGQISFLELQPIWLQSLRENDITNRFNPDWKGNKRGPFSDEQQPF